MSLQLTETCFINLFRNYIINKTTFDMSAVEHPGFSDLAASCCDLCIRRCVLVSSDGRCQRMLLVAVTMAFTLLPWLWRMGVLLLWILLMALGSCYIRPTTTVNDIESQESGESEQSDFQSLLNRESQSVAAPVEYSSTDALYNSVHSIS